MEFHVVGENAFGRSAAVFVEPRDEGAKVLISTPPAGVLLDWRQLDQLIHRLVELRQAMPGERGGR